MSANQQHGGPEQNHLQRFDELPINFKRLLWVAPEDYKVGWIYQLLARFGPAAALSMTRQRIVENTQATLEREWPAGHPQVARAGQ